MKARINLPATPVFAPAFWMFPLDGHYGSLSPQGSRTDIFDAESDFHLYTIDWSPERIEFFVDDQGIPAKG